MFSQVLFISLSSFKFSKAANLFVISMWYCFPTSKSLLPQIKSFPVKPLCCFLLTANLSLLLQPPDNKHYHNQLPWNFVYLVRSNAISYLSMWSISFWVFPLGEVQVYLCMFRRGNIVLLTTRFFDVAVFTILTPLSLLAWCILLFRIVGLKIFSLPSFALKSRNIFYISHGN